MPVMKPGFLPENYQAEASYQQFMPDWGWVSTPYMKSDIFPNQFWPSGEPKTGPFHLTANQNDLGINLLDAFSFGKDDGGGGDGGVGGGGTINNGNTVGQQTQSMFGGLDFGSLFGTSNGKGNNSDLFNMLYALGLSGQGRTSDQMGNLFSGIEV